jgi:N-methylhydantoinase A
MLTDLGYANPIRYFQSNGGLTSGRVFSRRAVSALNSGPAAGPSAALHFAASLGQSDVLTLDVGGTSSDISLVRNGKVDLVKDIDIGRYRVGIPLVNVISIGAGGGSIAWIDAQGLLHVGPQSAEAVPGPACYMRGGSHATVTDALVVLGYLNQNALLGGRMPIDAAAARQAVRDKVAEPLGLTLERAALGIFNIINANMIGGIRSVSVERGHDPRDFSMVAGGGATAAHAGRLAADLRIRTVIIPRIASGLCAFGEAVADVKHTYLTSYTVQLPELEPRRLNRLFRDLEDQGREDLREEGFADADIYVERSVDMKYVDQVHECRVEIPLFEIDDANVAAIGDAFHRRHEALYTYCEPDNVAELINIEVSVYGRSPKIGIPDDAPARTQRPEPDAHRSCLFAESGEHRPTAVFDAASLRVGDAIEGPAIVEEESTTIVVFPGSTLTLPRSDVYVMTIS